MIGHDSKRNKDEDESYEEEDKKKRWEAHFQEQRLAQMRAEEGPVMQTMMIPGMQQQPQMTH